MSSIPLYKAFIEVGASEQSATRAAEDVIQVSQLPQLATKADLAGLELATKAELSNLELRTKAELTAVKAELKNDISNLETRLLKWGVGCGFLFAGIIIAGVGLVIQIMLTPGVSQ